MQINCQCHSAKVALNTNRLNFASNNLDYNKGIHTNFACNKSQSIRPHYETIMQFKNLQDILSLKISEIELSWLLYCLKQITSFSSFDELKLHRLC